MFEHKSKPLLPRRKFYQRIALSTGIVVGIVAFSLFMGSTGYHYFAGLPWIDALLNASMILTGMGPVDPVKSTEAKLFATFYALYSGIAFLTDGLLVNYAFSTTSTSDWIIPSFIFA